MAQALMVDPLPLVSGADGVMRVSGTRVTIDTVLAAFAEGATAEEIAQQYPSISLADVYQVIGYYLRLFLLQPPQHRHPARFHQLHP
jgi:uncharacterized protein (DUF433 family)